GRVPGFRVRCRRVVRGADPTGCGASDRWSGIVHVGSALRTNPFGGVIGIVRIIATGKAAAGAVGKPGGFGPQCGPYLSRTSDHGSVTVVQPRSGSSGGRSAGSGSGLRVPGAPRDFWTHRAAWESSSTWSAYSLLGQSSSSFSRSNSHLSA